MRRNTVRSNGPAAPLREALPSSSWSKHASTETSRTGELFVSAFNPDKNWRSMDDWALGNFKLAGLSNVALTEDPFEPLPGFDNSLPRDGDQALFAVSVA